MKSLGHRLILFFTLKPPHATDHALGCTMSNEPGQPGSAYE